MKDKKQTLNNIITVIIGCLLMGFLWRIRGEHGWGAAWGVLNAGFIYSLFVVLFKGAREKLNIGWLAVTSISFMLTVPAWGTILDQITGVLVEAEFNNGTPVYVSIFSAVFLMLCIGFGMATLFGILLGRGFSDKQWKTKDLIILIAVFYITDLVTKATVSHWILGLVQPEAAQSLETVFAENGIEGSAWKVYLQHFDDVSWAKKIPNSNSIGRNYFQSIECISAMLRSIAAIVTARFIIKDKIAAKTGLVVSSAFAFAIAFADLFFYFGDGGYHKLGENIFPASIAPWSCWEYFTGFIAGGIITAYLIKLKSGKDVPELAFNKVPQKANNILTFIAGFIFLIGVSIVRPILERYDYNVVYQVIFTVIAVLAAVAFVVLLIKKWGFDMSKIDTVKYSALLLPFFMCFMFAAYLFTGGTEHGDYMNFNMFHLWCCLISFIAVMIWSINKAKKIK